MNWSAMQAADWRNRLLHTHLPPSVQRELRVYVVGLADGLYSQFDAHTEDGA